MAIINLLKINFLNLKELYLSFSVGIHKGKNPGKNKTITHKKNRESLKQIRKFNSIYKKLIS